MIKGNKLLNNLVNLTTILGIIFVFIFSIYRYQIEKNYLVFGQVQCDENNKKGCFILDCSENNSSDPRCVKVSSDGNFYYKLVEVKAKRNSLECKDSDNDCQIITCNDQTLQIYAQGSSCAE